MAIGDLNSDRSAVSCNGLLPPKPSAVIELTPATSMEDVGARAVQRFLNTGDPRDAVELHVAALRHELAQPYETGWWRIRRVVRPASEQLEQVLTKSAAFYERATETLRAKNTLAEAIIRHSTTQQRYELQRATHAAAIAEQKKRKAEHDAAARRAKHDRQKEHEDQVAELTYRAALAETEAKHLREYTERVEEQLNRERERAAAMAGALDEVEALKYPTPERRAHELAEAQHLVKLAEAQHAQAMLEARIQGLQEPDTARRRRAQRHAAREARETQDRTWLLDEYARKAEREIKRAEKKYGRNTDVVDHIRNQWNARLEALARSDGGPE